MSRRLCSSFSTGSCDTRQGSFILITRQLTAEPATGVAETGLQVLTFYKVHRHRDDEETRRAAPSPDAVSVEERLLLHPEVLEPEEVGQISVRSR